MWGTAGVWTMTRTADGRRKGQGTADGGWKGTKTGRWRRGSERNIMG
jgi:hypothetical protein